jgi:hypothetical protein
MLTRPLLKYMAWYLMSALRKSRTPRMYTTKLMSGKMAELLMVVMMPPQMDVMEPHEGSKRPKRSPKPNPKCSPDDYDRSYVGNKSRTRS